MQQMTDNRLSAIALIAGSCGSIITMAFHPSGHIAAAQLETTIRMLILVHALALACVPILFLGSLGLSQRLAGAGRLEVIGLVFYAFALVAVMAAAVADGLVTPSVLRQIVASADSESAANTWRMFSRYTFYLNQACAEVFVAGSSAAILAWSVAMWRNSFSRALGIYGTIVAAVTLAVMFSGHLPLDVHRFGAVVLGQAVWLVIAGTQLWSGRPLEVEPVRAATV